MPGAAVVADAPAARPEGGRGGGTRYPDLTAVAEAASQSVVSLAIWKGRRDRPAGGGSGVVIDADGSIVTNHHVIDGAERIEVKTREGRRFNGEVVGSDARVDLALVRALGDTSRLKPIALRASSPLRLGEWVLAVGHPFGLGTTVTVGIVSATGRADVGLLDFEDFIQTDAAINPGNSGGALVNAKGELVGINTAILSRSGGSQGIGFAIPANVAARIVALFRRDGAFRRGFLGAAAQDLNPEVAESMGVKYGVLIGRVQPGGPADRGGLSAGDVVTEIDGLPVTTSGRLRTLIATGGPARTVRLVVRRGAATKRIQVALGRAPGDGERPAPGGPRSPEPGGMNEP
ncbi:MAG: trypsin-like peptidase domain-containing protein [Myxococcota bacterium]